MDGYLVGRGWSYYHTVRPAARAFGADGRPATPGIGVGFSDLGLEDFLPPHFADDDADAAAIENVAAVEMSPAYGRRSNR